MRNWLLVGVLFFSTSCATVEQHAVASRASDVETFSSVGDVMLRVDVREDLPNVFGRADIYGRTRNLGFSEIRYVGLTQDGLAIFRRRDAEILTNEDTMNRSGFRTATVTAQPAGQGIGASGVATQAPSPNVQTLPPDTTEFTLNLAQGRIITMRDKTVEIIKATPSGIRFVIR